MSVAHDAREGTPEPAVVKPVYGFIKRVLRNGEQDKGDGFPVRDDVVVFGRDMDSTIKVIHETISRRHVELTVDPITYQATITVLGRSGATVRSPAGSKIKLKAGSSYALQHADVFKVHATSFSYTAIDPEQYRAESLASIGTPMAQRQAISTPAATPRTVPAHVHMPTAPLSPSPATASPLRVPAKIALSTPKGRMSLLKHTVLQSARKQWIAQKPPGLEGAVEDGNIEVKRRKSTSPNKGKGVVELSEDESDEEGVVVGEEQEQRVEEQEEQGDEMEEKYRGEIGEEAEMEGEFEDIEMDDASVPEYAVVESDAHHHSNDSHTEIAENVEEEMYEEAEHDETEDHDEPLSEAVAPATPPPARPLSAFFTPQIRPNAHTTRTDTRRSLAGIGSPAWRPAQFNKTVNPLASPAVRLGGRQQTTPSAVKGINKKEEEETNEDEVMTPVRVKQEKLQGPSADEIAEMKKRRQSLGTPRTLPTAPTSFKTPVPAFSFTKPVHPALAASHSTPDALRVDEAGEDDDDMQAPPTPLQSIRKQLDNLRLQAEERTNRRQSTGAGPRGPAAGASGVRTAKPTSSSSAPVLSFATPARTARTAQPSAHSQNQFRFNKPSGTPMPLAPMLEAEEGDSSVSSINLSALATPTRADRGYGSARLGLQVGTQGSSGPAHFTPVRPATAPRSHAKADIAGAQAQDASGASPAHTPAKTARKSTTPTRPPPRHMTPQTPDYTAIRHMMPVRAGAAATPNMAGLRRMLDTRVQPQAQAASPATPIYSGVRQLYPAIPAAVQTPDMRHMGKMYATPVQTSGRAVSEEYEEDGDAPQVIVSPVKHWGSSVEASEGEMDVEHDIYVQEAEPEHDQKNALGQETHEPADRYSAETDAEGLSAGEDESPDDSEEEEQEEVEYRSPVARRFTRSSPVKVSSPSEVSRRLLQSTATGLSLASGQVGRGGRDEEQQAMELEEADEQEEEEQEDEDEEQKEEHAQSTTRRAPVKAALSSHTGNSSGSDASTSRRRPARTATASTAVRPIKTEAEAVSKPAPARTTRRKAEPAAALEEAGVQGVVDEKPSVRAAASKASKGKTTRTAKSAPARGKRAGTAAAEAQDEGEESGGEAEVTETKSAPVRRTRTAVRATNASAPSTTAAAASKTTGKKDTASAPTRATRSTRAKGPSASTMMGEEKENVDVDVGERPSRSMRSRR